MTLTSFLMLYLTKPYFKEFYAEKQINSKLQTTKVFGQLNMPITVLFIKKRKQKSS